MIESILLTATRISTFDLQHPLTNATGFFFEREGRLFLVTSRHVVIDTPTKHFPSRIEIELHLDEQNMTMSTGFSIPLYQDGKSVWHQAEDTGGEIDVAVIEIDKNALPEQTVYRAFTPEHLLGDGEQVMLGSSLLVLGFPLGFHDTLHHLPVARHAVNASSFGLRFQGNGYFLTDARTHRGTSGAPVLIRDTSADGRCGDLPWRLLGIHSASLNMGNRDLQLDEVLGLNCTWYADVLMTLTL
jgi:S1-C subfamily serine protease